jgi:hypothetical protein
MPQSPSRRRVQHDFGLPFQGGYSKMASTIARGWACSVCLVCVEERLATARWSLSEGSCAAWRLARSMSSLSDWVRHHSKPAPRMATSDCLNWSMCVVIFERTRLTRAMRSSLSREAWMALETVPRNVGDDECCLYQTRTKSRAMRSAH